MTGEPFKCPACNSPNCDRDEVDIGVGTQYGPWQCFDCGWCESHYYDDSLLRDEPDPDLDGGGL